MSNDKMRAEFEAWHCSIVVSDPPHDKYPNGSYVNVHVDRYWIGWQASRATIVVELPPSPDVREDPEDAIDDSHMDAYYSAVQMREGCSKAITAAGLKVKP